VAQTSSRSLGCTEIARGASVPSSPITTLACKITGARTAQLIHQIVSPAPEPKAVEKGSPGAGTGRRAQRSWRRTRGGREAAGTTPWRPDRTPRGVGGPAHHRPAAVSTPRRSPSRPRPRRRPMPWEQLAAAARAGGLALVMVSALLVLIFAALLFRDEMRRGRPPLRDALDGADEARESSRASVGYAQAGCAGERIQLCRGRRRCGAAHPHSPLAVPISGRQGTRVPPK
jgi:hypothetical protein